MKSITNEFLDMFLRTCCNGEHSFSFDFGDGRRQAVTGLNRAEAWPHTVMWQNFPSVFRMVSAWVDNGRTSFLLVRSLVDGDQPVYPVEEIRCWSLTPLGAIPLSAAEAAKACGRGDTTHLWNMDTNREERYRDGWDDLLVLAE